MFTGLRLFDALSRAVVLAFASLALWISLALAGAFGLDASAQVPAQAPQGYYIVLTPSGVPYAVPASAPPPAGAVWPYPDQPPPVTGLVPRPAATPRLPDLPGRPPPPETVPAGTAPGETAPLPAVELGAPPAPPPGLAIEAPGIEAPAIEPPSREPPGEAPDDAEDLASSGTAKRYRDGIYVAQEDYLLSYPENALRILKAPLDFDQEDWLIAAGVAGAAGLALLADQGLSDFWQDEVRSDKGDDVFEVVEELGDFRYIGFASLAGYGVAEALDLKREKAATLLTLQSLILSSALTVGLKVATARERPTDTDDQYDFFERKGNKANASFPSGHASHAFSTATVLSEIYGEDNAWVPWVAYPLATGVSFARINKDRHWLSDILVGGAIGHFVAKLVIRTNPFLEEQGISVAPTTIGEDPGVAFTYAF